MELHPGICEDWSGRVPRKGRRARAGVLPGVGSLVLAVNLAVGLFVLIPAWVEAAQPPTVYHSPNSAGFDPQTPAEASETLRPLELWVRIGAVDSDVPNERVCVDGHGDESCGFTLVLSTTGDVDFGGFCLTNCAPDLVHHIDSATDTLRINYVGTIDQSTGPLHLGDLWLVQGPGGGTVFADPESQSVAADGSIGGFRDSGPLAISLPEPGALLGVALGSLLLIALGRVRCAGRARTLSLGIVVFLSSHALATRSGAQSFADEASFLAALTGTPAHVGFDTLPLSGTGFAALSNEARAGQARFEAQSLANDVELNWPINNPLGIFGTLLVADPTLSGDASLWPGGTGVGFARSHDDLRIRFDHPVRAAGLTILENIADPGEEIRFLDAKDNVIATLTLPGSEVHPGIDGFRGYITEAEDPPIAAIEIDESTVNSDEIGIDDLYYDAAADPFADALQLFSPGLVPSGPDPSNLDPAESLEAPDGTFVSLGVAGKLHVQFADNRLTGSGDSRPDLRIYEGGVLAERFSVEISANGQQWLSLGTVDDPVSELDLDAFGYDQYDVFEFVRLIDDPLDGPVTGPTVGADIDAVEVLSGTLDAVDTDSDHVPDAYDDCPLDYAVADGDRDGDGVGDFCDNCIDAFNPNQFDGDTDGVGNACEPMGLRLIRDFNPQIMNGKYDLADLVLDCGTSEISRIVVGVWIPPGANGITFGTTCTAPLAPVVPAGVTPGGGCPGGHDLGGTVSGARSGIYGNPAGIAAPAHVRGDVVHLVIGGVGPAPGSLCLPGQSGVPLGTLRANSIAPGGLQGGVVAFALEDGIESTEDLLAVGWAFAEDDTSSELDYPETAFFMQTAGTSAVAEVILQPAASEPSYPANAWDVCVGVETVPFMHRVTVGLLGPNGADYGTQYIEGCTDPETPSGIRTCSEEVGADPTWVDEVVTRTRGPLPAHDGTVLRDTVYAPLEGGAQGSVGGDVLNPAIGRDHCVGAFANLAPPATNGAPPIPIRNGFESLPYDHDPGQPYQTVDASIESLEGESVYETILFNAGDDLDLDGHVDTNDNCPFEANSDQSDVGGVGSAEADGTGDACQCGDVNGTGSVLAVESGSGGPIVSDLQLMREYLVGMHPSDPDLERRCSVAGDTACNAADAAVLARALADPTFPIDQRCDAAVD